jgi:Tfp pilus assembly protein PilN
MSGKKTAINLLPQEEFEASTLGRVLHWAMGSFRIIVIVTEMIVMGAFLSRFWLDAQNSNLSDSIKIASSQIEVQSEFETKFRNIQTKLAIFKAITQNTQGSEQIKKIAEKIPNGIKISSIAVHDSTTDIKGDSDGEMNVAQLISNLKTDPSVKKIELGSLNTSEENKALISFQINISY